MTLCSLADWSFSHKSFKITSTGDKSANDKTAETIAGIWIKYSSEDRRIQHDLRCAAVELVKKIYINRKGSHINQQIIHCLQEYDFQGGRITIEEEQFLTDHYDLAYKFLWLYLWGRDKFSSLTLPLSKSPEIPVCLASLLFIWGKLSEMNDLFIPSTGLGEFLFPLIEENNFKINISGYEENPIFWALTQIRLCEIDADVEIILGNDLDNADNHKFIIYCFEQSWDNYDYLITKLYNKLETDGLLVALCPSVFFAYPDFFGSPANFFENSLSHIIQFPFNVITPESFCGFFLRKKDCNMLHLFDATECFHDLPYDSIRQFDINELGKAKTFTLSYSDVERNDSGYPLLLPSVQGIIKERNALCSNHQLIALSELVTPLEMENGCFPNVDSTLNEKGPIAITQTSHFSSLYSDYGFVTSGATIFVSCLDENHIKIGYTEDAELKVNCDFAFAPIPGVPPLYIAALMSSRYMKLCISYLLSNRDVENWSGQFVKVPKLTVAEQWEYIAKHMIGNMTIGEIQLTDEIASFHKGLRMRKHAISQTLSSMSSLWLSFMAYQKRKGYDLFGNDTIGIANPMQITDLLTKISNLLGTLSSQVEHIADNDFSVNTTEIINVEKFLLEYAAEHKSPNYLITGLDRIPDNLSIHAQKEALIRILDNIFSNAKEHGFVDPDFKYYEINITCFRRRDDSHIVIAVSNNGEPLKEGLNPSQVLEYGYSSQSGINGHMGLGGSEISSIMSKLNGNVQVLIPTKGRYSITYQLIFND